MSDLALQLRADRGTGALRLLFWGGCFVLVLLLHATALLWLAAAKPMPGLMPQDAIMLDLAPDPTAAPAAPLAPSEEPTPRQPQDPAPAEQPPKQPQPEQPRPEPLSPDPPPPEQPPAADPAPPVPQVAAPSAPEVPPPVPQAEVALPPPPPPQPVSPPRKPPPRPRSMLPRQVAAAKPPPSAPPPSAPAPLNAPAGPGTTAPVGQNEATWQARLLAHLARFKRFPAAAQRRGEQGTVLMRFIMSRDGTVLAMSTVRGSGYADLDEEARAWMARAQPLPAFPADMTAQQMALVVPLRFVLN